MRANSYAVTLRRGPLTAITGVLAALAAALFLSPPGAEADGACDRFASPSGSDSASGTLASPYASPQELIDSLASGQTGCLRTGTYSFSTLLVNQADITLAPYGTDAVTLKGTIKVPPTGTGATIEGMKLNGQGGSSAHGPRIYASDFRLLGNEITNQHTGICVIVSEYYGRPKPEGVAIKRNRIHDCGELPATNHEHGIYLSEARDAVIRNNWIYDNADRGIQQYPDTDGSLITGNVIDGNGQGLNFSGRNASCSSGNVVEHNVISNSRIHWNAYSGTQGDACASNVVRDNCAFASNDDPSYNVGDGIQPDSRSFDASSNLVASPRYQDADSNDLRLRADSECLAMYTGTLSSPGPAAE